MSANYIKFNSQPDNKYEAVISVIGEHIVQVAGAMMNESGFILYDGENDKPIGNYSDYTTEYRKIDAYTFQYSNDGSKYEPKVDIKVSALWNDDNNSDGIRPLSVDVSLTPNQGDPITVSLNASMDWAYTFENLDATLTYTFGCGDVNKYTSAINGYSVTYSHTSANIEKTNKKNELDTIKNTNINSGIIYKENTYIGSVKEELEIANQTHSEVECQGQWLNGEDLSNIFIQLEELEIYETKYCDLLKQVVDACETAEDVREIQYGDNLPADKAEELELYVANKNSIIEFYANQLCYANYTDLTVTQGAVAELYEMIINMLF